MSSLEDRLFSSVQDPAVGGKKPCGEVASGGPSWEGSGTQGRAEEPMWGGQSCLVPGHSLVTPHPHPRLWISLEEELG